MKKKLCICLVAIFFFAFSLPAFAYSPEVSTYASTWTLKTGIGDDGILYLINYQSDSAVLTNYYIFLKDDTYYVGFTKGDYLNYVDGKMYAYMQDGTRNVTFYKSFATIDDVVDFLERYTEVYGEDTIRMTVLQNTSNFTITDTTVLLYNTIPAVDADRNVIFDPKPITIDYPLIASPPEEDTSWLGAIGEWFNNLGSSIVDGFAAVGDFIIHLFIPTNEDWSSLMTDFSALLGESSSVGAINKFFGGISDAFQNSTTPPSIEVNLGAAEGSLDIGSGFVKVINFSWFARYKPMTDTFLSIILWGTFAWIYIKRLPDIIGGAGMITLDGFEAKAKREKNHSKSGGKKSSKSAKKTSNNSARKFNGKGD